MVFSKRKASLFLLAAVICVLASFFIPLRAEAARVLSSEVIKFGPEETVADDLYLFGNTVTVSGTVLGDTIIFAREAIIDGKIKGSLLVFAEMVRVTGEVEGTARGASNSFFFQGSTARDLLVAANTISVTGSIGWDFFGAASNLTVTGPVGRDMKVATKRLVVDGPVGGSIETTTDELIIGPGAKIGGRITYTSEKEATVDQNAVIGGVVKRLEPVAEPAVTPPGRRAWRFARPIFSLLLVALLMALFFPVLTAGAAQTIRGRAALSTGYGALVVFAAPIASLILLFTVIGLPVALLTMLLYTVLLYLSRIFAGYFLAQLALDYFNKKLHPVWTALFGVLVLALLTRIPFIGWLIHLAAVLIASGAFIAYLASNKEQRTNCA